MAAGSPIAPSPADRTPHAWTAVRMSVVIGTAVFLACLAGIAMRPTGFFSAFWPANALLLGLLVRWQFARSPMAWGCAALGFVAADLVTGSAWATTAWLAAANLMGVATGALLYSTISVQTRQMRHQLSVLYLFGICSVSAGISALVGGSTGPVIFQAPWLPSVSMWFSSELLNYVVITPLLLTAPRRGEWRAAFASRRPDVAAWTRVAPWVSVLVAESTALAIGGPGAIAFVVPALLWCALSYTRFVTCLLCLAVCLWKTMEVAAMALVAFMPDQWVSVFSLRIGISLLTLGPLGVACASASRDEVFKRLNHAVTYDFLTDALARGAFLQRLTHWLAEGGASSRPSAMLMLDIDHFKQINDVYGHATGDCVLATFARTVSASLRPGDLLGRMGGEEFAVLLPGATPAQATEVAQRLCAATRTMAVQTPQGAEIHVTVSVGAACHPAQGPGHGDAGQVAERMLAEADRLLYQAKAQGRDRIVCEAAAPGGRPAAHRASH